MELRHIKQFSTINGVRTNPTLAQDGKFPRWNNTTEKFDFVTIGEGDINETYITDIVNFPELLYLDILVKCRSVGFSTR